MKLIKSKFFVFLSTFVLGVAFFWIAMVGLAILDKKGFINKYDFDPQTIEIILDIQCGNDYFCRYEICPA